MDPKDAIENVFGNEPQQVNPGLPNAFFLTALQRQSQEWREKCFPPEHRTAPLQVLGVCEEAGELAHAVLKMEQGIRGSDEMHLAAAQDAAGDILIYLCGVATALGFDLQAAAEGAWREVAKRDWSQHKHDGLS